MKSLLYLEFTARHREGKKHPSPISHRSFTDKNDINNSNGEGMKGNINTLKDTRNFRDKRSRSRWGLTARDEILSRKGPSKKGRKYPQNTHPFTNGQRMAVFEVKDG